MNAETMNAADVIRIAEFRGFKVMLSPGPPPMPFLRGKAENVTEPLMEALKAFREEIILELTQLE